MRLLHKTDPTIIKPLAESEMVALREHVRQIRKAFDWPGVQYHDADREPNQQVWENLPSKNSEPGPKQKRQGIFTGDKFNRWFWHNLPALVAFHHDPGFLRLANETFGRSLKPSYAFLSMYGPDGICPLHQDRPQCQFTIDLQIDANGSWPIYVDEKPYILKNGEALCYSGTGQPHYRKPMNEDGKGCTFMNLAFFHFVPAQWQGALS